MEAHLSFTSLGVQQIRGNAIVTFRSKIVRGEPCLDDVPPF